MIRKLWWKRRWTRLHQAATASPVKSYLQSPPAGLFETPPPDTPMLALDLETTGLDPEQDAIVAMSWVPVEAGRVLLHEARSEVVRTATELPPSSVVIHGLGDDRVAQGVALDAALTSLLEAMTARIVIAHHAGLDLGFVNAAVRRLWGSGAAFACIDTLVIAEEFARRRQQSLPPGSLTLATCRDRYGLPPYPPHDPLWDAVGAAELWLALRADLFGNGPIELDRVVRLLP